MANAYIGWVNMQLVSVRHHLSLLLEEKNANDRLRNRGVLESAAWHLGRAYRYYLYELGANYQLKEPEANDSAKDLGQALESIGKHPGEAAELAALERNGWIADLKRVLADFKSLGNAPRSPKSAFVSGSPSDTKSSGDLEVINLDPESIDLSAETLHDWLEKFRELSSRHREVMVEY